MIQLALPRGRVLWPLAILGLAPVAGVLVALQPALAAALGALALTLLAAVHVRGSGRVFWAVLAFALIGYMFAGRGFAYVGPNTVLYGERYAPPFIGEFVVLAAGIVALARFTSIGWTEASIVALMVLGVVRTVPYLGTYGLDALRDAVIWGYGVVALAVAAIATPAVVRGAVRVFGIVLIPFLIWYPLQFVVAQTAPQFIPEWSFGVPLVFLKFGDSGVHLAAIAVFLLLGLRVLTHGQLVAWALWAASAGIVAAGNRGAMVAIMAAIGVMMLLRPTSRVIHLTVAALLVTVSALVILPSTASQTTSRFISVDQLFYNAVSLFEDSVPGGLAGTKHYRLRWWGTIVDYTVGGEYFLTGKGFGINLADADGFQVTEDGSLRSPHNGHLTFLARMGVPGLILWLLVIGLLVGRLVLRVFRARSIGETWWSAVMIWLTTYLVAMLVNSTFDPYLESPQGGIWFWAVAGLGIAACRAFDAVARERQRTGAGDRTAIGGRPATGEAADAPSGERRAGGGPAPAPAPSGA